MKSKKQIKQKDVKKKKYKPWTMNNKMMNTMNTKNNVNEEPQCKTWQRAQWYGWWIIQNKNIAKRGGCILLMQTWIETWQRTYYLKSSERWRWNVLIVAKMNRPQT
jgi:hypothetical protein